MNEMAHSKLLEALGYLNTFIGDAPYMAGDKITIADFSIIAAISTLDVSYLHIIQSLDDNGVK